MANYGEPDTVPLYLFWTSQGSKDNMVTTDAECPQGYTPADYGYGLDGQIYASAKPGTRPLFLYFNDQKNDHMTVASDKSIDYVKSNGYTLIKTLGYVLEQQLQVEYSY